MFQRIAAGAAAAALIAAAGAALWQARQAEERRSVAERQFERARRFGDWVLSDFDGAKLTSKSLEYLDGLAEDASGDARLQADLATAYMAIAARQQAAGDRVASLETYRRAVAVAGRAHGSDPSFEPSKLVLADAYLGLAASQTALGRTRASVTNLHRACGMLDSLKAPDAAQQAELARCLIQVGDSLGHPDFPNVGDGPGALENYRRALTIAEKTGDAGAAAEALERVGDMLGPGEALASYERALAARGNQPDRAALARIHHRIGRALDESGDRAKAAEHHRQGLAIAEALAAANPKDATARRALAHSQQAMAGHYAKSGNMAKAVDAYRRALAILETSGAGRELAIAHRDMARMLERAGQTAAAAESDQRAIRQYEQMLAAEPANEQYRRDLCDQLEAVAVMFEKNGPAEKARPARERWLAQLKQFATADNATTADRERYAKASGESR